MKITVSGLRIDEPSILQLKFRKEIKVLKIDWPTSLDTK